MIGRLVYQRLMLCATLAVAGCSNADLPTSPLSIARLGLSGTSRADAGKRASTAEIKHDDSAASALARRRSANASSRPNAVIEADSFDFGIMAPDSQGEHAFTIRNNGTAAMTLKQGTTTCQCTLVDFPGDEIPPGSAATVHVTWTTPPKGEFYQQAIVRTNDPEHAEIRFTIHGTVQHRLAWSASPIILGEVSPNEKRTHRVLVFSQVWDSFVIERCESSWEGLTFSISKAEKVEFNHLHAKAAYAVQLELPESLEPGNFQHWVRIEASPVERSVGFESNPLERAAEPEPGNSLVVAETQISGKVLRRLCIYGKGIDAQGRLRLGRLAAGNRHEFKFVVKVRDRTRGLSLVAANANPSFMDVTFAETEGSETLGLYELTIAIPADAPTGIYRSVDGSQLHLDFEHARIEDLTLPIDFSLMP